MTKQLQFGLIAEGNSRHSQVLQLPRLAEDLGPVKSSAFGVARKLSNFLRAGYAVSEYEELQSASVILLRVPDSTLPRIISELCSAGLPFANFSIVLCESWLTIEALAPLRNAGANVATLMSVPTAGRNWYLVEGEAPAVRRWFREGKALGVRPSGRKLRVAHAQPPPLKAEFVAAFSVGILGSCLESNLPVGGWSSRGVTVG